MNNDDILHCLQDFASKKISIELAQERLRGALRTHDGSALVDVNRQSRLGAPEAIYGEGKTPAQIVSIAKVLDSAQQNILVTRANAEQAEALSIVFPEADYDAESRTIVRQVYATAAVKGCIGVICAGTTDRPVAEEAIRTLSFFGVQSKRFYDVGVAGLHRILNIHEELQTMDALLVVAGMDGALPAVVGGLVPCPVVAVPTSVGYGTAFSGVAPLLGMLNACSAGIVVVNIDNGFGAARAVHRMLRAKGTVQKQSFLKTKR